MNERIVCAANRNKNGDVVLGVRHHCPLMNSAIEDYCEAYDTWSGKFSDQGFITNKGRYVSREEAWIIAEREGQIIRRVGGDTYQVNNTDDGEVIEIGRLFSENLY